MKAHTDKTRPAASRRRALRAILGAAAAAVPLTTAMLWPAGPAAAQANPLGSNANYTLINACRPIDGLTVSLHVSQDMMSLVTGGYFNVDVPNGGFALQLNGAPPSGTGFQWLQFGIIVEQGQALGFTQYWNPEGIDEHNQPVIVDLPSDMIAAGSILTIQLGNDGSGNVDSITYGVTDPTGRRTSLAMPLPDYSNASYPNNGQPVLIPIEAFQVNLIGPINIENSMFYSGGGYLSYQVSSGSLTVQQSAGQCPEVYEAWEQAGTGETSNALYGLVTPGAASTLVQPVTTAFGGALASNMDTVDNEVQVYHLAGGGASRTVQLDASLFNGGWTGADVNANAACTRCRAGQSDRGVREHDLRRTGSILSGAECPRRRTSRGAMGEDLEPDVLDQLRARPAGGGRQRSLRFHRHARGDRQRVLPRDRSARACIDLVAGRPVGGGHPHRGLGRARGGIRGQSYRPYERTVGRGFLRRRRPACI